MARIRSIKPSFFQSDDVSALPLRARLTWIGLWTHCDDAGRAKDHLRLIKAAIWPLDNVSLADIEEDLSTLARHGRIVRYEVDGQRFLAVTNWSHQRIDKPTPSRLPGPHSPNGTGSLQEDSRGEGRGREGKGGDARASAREPPPPKTCPKHPTGTENPCRACQRARQAAETWEAERRSRAATAPKCKRHRGEVADNCRICRAEELNPA